MWQLNDDERFTLMETIIQAFEDHPASLHANSLWQETLILLDTGIDLHAFSVWYWSDLENEFVMKAGVSRHIFVNLSHDIRAG